jgi:hypothetical protein
MSPPSLIRLKPTRHLHHPINPYPSKTTIRPLRCCGRWLHEACPEFSDACPSCGEHAVLKTVKDSTVDGRDETAGDEAEDDARGEIVFSEAVTELEVLVEHGAEGEGYGL